MRKRYVAALSGIAGIGLGFLAGWIFAEKRYKVIFLDEDSGIDISDETKVKHVRDVPVPVEEAEKLAENFNRKITDYTEYGKDPKMAAEYARNKPDLEEFVQKIAEQAVPAKKESVDISEDIDISEEEMEEEDDEEESYSDFLQSRNIFDAGKTEPVFVSPDDVDAAFDNDFDTLSFTLYSDNVYADSLNDFMEDDEIDVYIGPKLRAVVEESLSTDTFYILNNAIGVNVEIARDVRTYQESVSD